MADVAVVGAGLIGAGIAYELAKRGATVVVYDRDEPARAASWAGAGMLAPFSEVIEHAAMRALCTASFGAYPAFVEELRERTGVDARFRRDGTLHVALDAPALESLRARAAGCAEAGGDVHVLDRPAALSREAALARSVTGALFVANEAQVDNRRLGRALVAACIALEVRFERTAEVAVQCDARRVRGLRTQHGFVPATTVVNAAGAWAGALDGVPAGAQVPVVPVAGEMVALAVPHALMRALIWHGHTYLVPRADGRVLIGATVVERGFDARVTAGGVRTLLDTALQAVPALSRFALVETWAGLRPATPDRLPVIGATNLEGYFVAGGHFRNGILLAPVTARAVAELIATGTTDVATAAFAPSRFLPGAMRAAAN
ncbi:MAG: glycine oxidase ThiO [Candidatus Velthaea sp.]